MSLKEILRFISRRLIEFFVIGLLIVFLPRVPPDATFSKSYRLAPVRPFEGALTLNTKLDAVEFWHKGEINSPEAFVDYNDELYTGVHGGDVIKLVGNHMIPVVKFGKPCRGIFEERLCGRPLGMAFDDEANLYVADCYYGLFKYNLKTGKKDLLVPFGTLIDGLNVTLPNSVTISSKGDIYWSDSSTQFRLEDGIFDFLADGSGRLIHYDPKTKKNTVLIKELKFANGVALADDESFVLVSESGLNRIHRYYLKGPKKGSQDIFIDGLPGVPDNLKVDGKGGFLVPLVLAVDEKTEELSQAAGPYPLFRKFLARILGLVQFLVQTIDDLYPNDFAKKGVHFIGHFTMISAVYPGRTTILHVSRDGEILDSLHSLNGKLNGISEVHIFKDYLYLGSPYNDYIGRIPLAQVGWEHLKPTDKPTPKTTTTTEKGETQKQAIKDQPKAVPVNSSPKKN